MSAITRGFPAFFLASLFQAAFGQHTLHDIKIRANADQHTLDSIENRFSTKEITLADSVGDSIITNELKLYKKISSRCVVNFCKKIDRSSDIIKKGADYYKYRFKDSVIFNNMYFGSDVDFSLAKCASFVSFHQSVMGGKALFQWAQFHDVVFSRINFMHAAVFQHAVFDGSCDFFESHFYTNTDFYGSQFYDVTNFGNTSFGKETDFSFTNLDANCIFRNAEFGRVCLFNNSTINATLDFTGAKFDSLAAFSFCSLKGLIIFSNTTLPAYLDLSGVEPLNSIIDLTQTKTSETEGCCRINLINADVSKIKLAYENFQLWFPEHTSYETKCKVYEDLLTSLHSFGFNRGYQKLDIEYKQLQYRNNNQFVKNKIQQIWWNYGYDKEKIFTWIFWIVLTLTVINSLFIRLLMGSIYEMKYLDHSKIVERHKLHHPLLDFFLNIPTGFLYTVILLAGGAFGIKFNSDQIRFPNFIGMLYIISIGLLGISCSAFLLKFIFNL